MTESELYKELGELSNNKDKWKESIPYISSLLTHNSVRIQAKALWLLGEMGLAHPMSVQDAVPAIASFLDSPEPLLRERAVNALGRIGNISKSVGDSTLRYGSVLRMVKHIGLSAGSAKWRKEKELQAL